MSEKIHEIKPEFVKKFIPEKEDMKPGILYISVEFRVAIQLCPCGCDRQSVTSLANDKGWGLTISPDRKTVSLSPSISDPVCKAHFFVKANKIQWC